MKRPELVQVLTTVFDIQWLTEDDWAERNLPEDSMGQCDGARAVISLRSAGANSEDVLRSTLLHEVLHACTQATKFDKYMKDVEDSEEFFVAMVTPTLLAVLTDNPELVKYLVG